MGNAEKCPTPRAGPVTRPSWEAGAYLTAAACSTEQNYRLQKLRRHNRKMHAWGVLCGMWVVPTAEGSHPWAVKICPGFAIGPYGDEIELAEPAQVNIEDYLWFKPDNFAAIAVVRDIAFVVIRYQDWLDDLEALAGAPCECKPTTYMEARTGDGYQAGAIWALPPRQGVDEPGICDHQSPSCPPCPPSPWVVLARVVLPARGTPITAAMIDNGIRTNL